MINYEYLKNTAKELQRQGVKVNAADLIVLAPKNDPFYSGTPSQRRDAEWFANVYQQLGGGSSIHLRRVHYVILDLPAEARKLPIELSTVLTKPDGGKREMVFTHYENYERCWDWLNEAAKQARWLGLVPVDAFVDRRAKEESFTFNANWSRPGDLFYTDPTPGYSVSGGLDEDVTLPDLPSLDYLPTSLGELPGLQTEGYNGLQQPCHVEIWIEKAEGDDVFLPLCRRYGVNLVPGVGDMSITTTYQFCQRVRRAGRPAKILYISDFDPSGYNMPIAVARKLEYFVRNHGFDDLDITLEPAMLTEAQVQEYNLPPAPVKDTDARKGDWEARFGGAVELNSMFARQERITAARRIIEAAILKYYDPTLTSRAERQRKALEAHLAEIRDVVVTDIDWELDSLADDYKNLTREWDDLVDELDVAIAPFEDKIAAYQSRLSDILTRAARLNRKASNELQDIGLDVEEAFPLPEAVTQSSNGILYDSQRDYWTQLTYYRRHKGVDDAAWLNLVNASVGEPW
jgi:hypothetical protein